MNTIRLGRGEDGSKQWAVCKGGLLSSLTNDLDTLVSPIEFSVIRATSATRVNELGLIERVDANVPRIDFLNDHRGELLIEPQRSNLILNSNIESVVVGTGYTRTSIDSNIIIGSIDRNISYTLNGTAYSYVSFGNYNLSTLTDYTISAVIKPNVGNEFFIGSNGSAAGIVVISVNTDTLSTTIAVQAAANLISKHSVKALSNGYFLVSFTWQQSLGTTSRPFFSYSWNTQKGTIGDNVDIAYFQLELGNYPTSYIPTTGSAVTRNADIISASNLGNVISDSEGGIFVELAWFDITELGFISINDNTTSNRIFIFPDSGTYQIRFGTNNSSGDSGNAQSSYTPINNVFAKIAGRFAVNDLTGYFNGIQIGSDTSVSAFPNGTLTRIDLNQGGGSLPFYGRIRQMSILDKAPTNSELGTSTAPVTEVLRRPVISGESFVNSVLTAYPGTWSTGTNGPVTSSYIWQSSVDGNTWTDIIGTTNISTYTILSVDIGKYIRILQTVTDGTTTDILGSFSSNKVTDIYNTIESLFTTNGYTEIDAAYEQEIIESFQ